MALALDLWPEGALVGPSYKIVVLFNTVILYTISMRSILHWDGDAFYASIEQAADKRLRGRPLAIGGDRRGIVLSSSIEARRFGIRPGMTMTRARRLCPPLLVLPGHFDRYEQFSKQILCLCQEETPLVEPVGVGAAWADLTGMGKLKGRTPEETVAQLRRTVWDWLRVSISVGHGANKTVARIASRLRKPGALIHVPKGEEANFLAPLPVNLLPGVNYSMRSTLEVAGILRVGQLARAPLEMIHTAMGQQAPPKAAILLQRRAQGVDEDPVRPPKTVDPQWREIHEFAEDVWDQPQILRTLKTMCDRLMGRLRTADSEVRRLTLTITYTDRDESYRTASLPEPTCVETDFYSHLEPTLKAAWTRRVRLRALMLTAGTLYKASPQLSLFAPEKDRVNAAPKAALSRALDALRLAYGEGAVTTADRLAATEQNPTQGTC